MTEESFFTYAGNTRIHYHMVGNGPLPILFLHGFASSSTTWQDLITLFPAAEYTLYLLDLKGFGLSSKPKDGAYSIEDQAEIVRTFILAQGFRSLVLVGHSLGGAVALRVSIEAERGDDPFTTEKLVLIDSAAYPQRLPRFFRKLKSPFGPLFLRLIPVRKLVQGVLERVFFDKTVITPDMFERYKSYFRGKGIAHALRATVKAVNPDAYVHIEESYRRLALPVLIIWGDEDRNVRLSLGQRLHGDISGSRLKVLEKCGHNPHEERPEETCAAILSFLKET
ncbi:MAG: alpha/beta hydrolase [Geobacteraceae bacterium]|nr:alpha/beta hydrolase [Geobacteraceae bacterium]